MIDWLLVVKAVIAGAFLTYASWLDWKSRIVPNSVWKFMLAALLPFTLVEFFVVGYDVTFAIVQLVLVVGFTFLLYVAGAFGGADAKALMVLAAVFPVYPSMFGLPVLNKGFGVFGFSVLANSVVFTPVLVLGLFVYNVMKEGIRNLSIYYFFGYKVDADRIPKFHKLFEYVNEDGEPVLTRKSVEADKKRLAMLREAKKKGLVERVWVTPELPYMIPITAGYVLALLVGDLVVWFVKFAL